jgi:small subunit ribosomal protein S16
MPSLTRGSGTRSSGLAGPHPEEFRSYRDCWEKTTPVAVKIKLKRLGKIRSPYYRVVVADARAKRDGRAIEEIGKYHPKHEPSLIEINSERAQYWLSVGAQPTDPVRNLLKITGDWQRFRGEDGAEGTLKTAAPRPGKQEAFAAALKDAHGEAEGAATTQKERGRRADTKADKADGRPARASRSSRSGSGGGKAGAEADAEKAAAPEGESGKAGADGKAGTGKAGTAEASKAAGKPERASPRATKAAEKAGGKQDKQEKAAATDGADSGEPGEATEDGETAKAGSRGSRKRSSGPKARAASGSSDKADADKADADKADADKADADEAGSEG